MTDIDRETCRRAAAECIELARVTSDPAKKELLLTRAQEWLKLAYANNDADFGRLIAGLNDSQMSSAPVQRQPMQQQPVQQQQSKIEPDDKTS
jgi:hypothetical protein